MSLATIDGNHHAARRLAQHLSRAAVLLDGLGEPPWRCDQEQRQLHRQRAAAAVAVELRECRQAIDRLLDEREQ